MRNERLMETKDFFLEWKVQTMLPTCNGIALSWLNSQTACLLRWTRVLLLTTRTRWLCDKSSLSQVAFGLVAYEDSRVRLITTTPTSVRIPSRSKLFAHDFAVFLSLAFFKKIAHFSIGRDLFSAFRTSLRIDLTIFAQFFPIFPRQNVRA